jgi:amino acid permease
MSGLFRRKNVDDLLADATPLTRTLKTMDLTFLGIGAIIGTGIFVLTGKGALNCRSSSISFVFNRGNLLWLYWTMLCRICFDGSGSWLSLHLFLLGLW